MGVGLAGKGRSRALAWGRACGLLCVTGFLIVAWGRVSAQPHACGELTDYPPQGAACEWVSEFHSALIYSDDQFAVVVDDWTRRLYRGLLSLAARWSGVVPDEERLDAAIAPARQMFPLVSGLAVQPMRLQDREARVVSGRLSLRLTEPERLRALVSEPELPGVCGNPEDRAGLRAQLGTAYVIQLLSAQNLETARRLVAAVPARNGVARLICLNDREAGVLRHVVVHGPHASRSAAQQALRQLPERLRRLKGWIRPLGDFRQALD